MEKFILFGSIIIFELCLLLFLPPIRKIVLLKPWTSQLANSYGCRQTSITCNIILPHLPAHHLFDWVLERRVYLLITKANRHLTRLESLLYSQLIWLDRVLPIPSLLVGIKRLSKHGVTHLAWWPKSIVHLQHLHS